jgi:hypothetical protein
MGLTADWPRFFCSQAAMYLYYFECLNGARALIHKLLRGRCWYATISLSLLLVFLCKQIGTNFFDTSHSVSRQLRREEFRGKYKVKGSDSAANMRNTLQYQQPSVLHRSHCFCVRGEVVMLTNHSYSPAVREQRTTPCFICEIVMRVGSTRGNAV